MTRRSRHIVTVSLFAISLTVAHAETTPSEPTMLTAARRTYESQCATVISPIRDRYVQWLEKAKREYGAKGDLKAALAFDDELARISPAKKELASTQATREAKQPAARVRFSNLTIKNTKPWSVISFYGDGNDWTIVRRLSFNVIYLCKSGKVYRVVAIDKPQVQTEHGNAEVRILVPPAAFRDKNDDADVPVSAYLEAILDGEQVWTSFWNKRGPDDWWVWDAATDRFKGEQQPAR